MKREPNLRKLYAEVLRLRLAVAARELALLLNATIKEATTSRDSDTKSNDPE